MPVGRQRCRNLAHCEIKNYIDFTVTKACSINLQASENILIFFKTREYTDHIILNDNRELN